MKLTIKIPLFIGTIVLVGSIAMLIAVGINVRIAMEKSSINTLKSEVHSGAYFLEAKLDAQLDVLAEIATRIRVRSMDWSVVQPALKADVARLGALDLAMATPEGISHYVLDNTTLNVKDRDYFQQAMAGKKSIGIVISRISGRLVALLAVPIYRDEGGKGPIVGVLIARKDGSKVLSDLVASLEIGYKTGYAYLLNSEGTTIGHRDNSLVEKQFNPIKEAEKDASAKSVADMATKALKEEKGVAKYNFNNKELITAYETVPGFPWSLFIAMDKSELDEEQWQISKVMILVGLVCLIAGIFVAIAVGRAIAMPLARVVAALKNITQGEGDLTQSIEVHSKDEVGDLAIYFNKLMKTIRVPIAETKEVINDLSTASDELSRISKGLKSASDDTVKHAASVTDRSGRMAENINTMASGAEQASVNAGDVASTAEEMSVNMHTVASAVEEMSSSITEIAGNTSDVLKIATSATAKSVDATQVMSKLGMAAKEIGHVTDVIKRIADKTNLLALNATIEAASAGEAGKGFAVVAGEIKELANQSAQSADDIARRIESIQTETNDAVKVISEVSEIIRNINSAVEVIATHVEQQTKASNEISNNVSQANAGAKRVANSVGEVARGANDVSKNAGEAARRVTQVTEEVAIMSNEANKSNSHASELNVAAGHLIKMADDLRTVMGRFKV